MNKTIKKALALVLMMIMVLSSVPMTSFAASIICSKNLFGHDWSNYSVTTPATCKSKGVETRYCKHGCGETDTKEIAISSSAHARKNVDAKDSTCVEYGNKAGVICELCGVTLEGYERVAPKGHKSVALAAKDPTCTEDGNEVGTKCEVCNEILSAKKIEKTGHRYTLFEQVAADCKNDLEGTKTDICLNCGDKKTETVEPKHAFGIWRTTEEATCAKNGKKTRTCTVSGCSGKEEITISKLEHVEESVVASDATCTTDGKTAGKRCKLCKQDIEGHKSEVIPARGHNYITVKGTAPTCDVAGSSDLIYCSVCGDIQKKAEPINALGHKLKKDEKNSKPASCTETGIDIFKCENEGCTYTKTEALPITHESNNWVTISTATCTTDGKQTGYCKYCGKSAERITKALDHLVTYDSSWRVTKSATCTETGTKSAPCERPGCGQTATKSIPALGHNETVKTAAVAPTCTTEGKSESKHCSRCGLVTVNAEKIEKLAHTYKEWVVTTAPTCQVAGLEKATCTACNTETKRTVDKLAHTEEEIPAVAATCTTAGSTAGIKCKVCNAKIKDTTVMEALGHAYVLDETASIKPTCDTVGREKGKCSRCNEEKDEVVPALGHTETAIPGTPADCINSGIKEGKECTVCKRVLVDIEPIPALGHDPVLDPNKSKAATCTEKGYSYSKCSRCDYIEEKEVAPIEHTWGEWKETTPATCEAEGEQTRLCSVCNTIDTQSISSLGGHVVATLPGKEATCTEPGKTAGSYCERCETIFEDQLEIQAPGHVLGEQREIVKKASTTQDGEYAYRCTVCDGSESAIKIAKIDESSIKLAATSYYYNGKARTPAVTVKDTDGNELIKGQDYEVIYDTGRKNPGKYNVQITFIGNYEGEANLSFSIKPVKTAKVSYENKGDHILITWEKVNVATGYTIYIYKNSENGTTRKALKTLTGTSYKLTKDYNGKALNLDEEYRIAVVSRAKTEDGTILKSKANITTVTRKLQKPTLTVTTASGKANLKWTNIANETGYEVVYATSKDGTYKKLTTTKVNVVTFSKAFTKNSTVYFKVRAYKTVDGDKFYSNYSAVKSVKIK